MRCKGYTRKTGTRNGGRHINLILPFWNSELYVEISAWFPFGKDYQPISVNRFYDDNLKRIAELCFDLNSEFFFMASPQTGCVGNLPRENFFKYSPDRNLTLGFLMVLGYSEEMEKAIIAALGILECRHEIFAGITACSLWSSGTFNGTTKVIAIASNEPFFDSTDFLKGFAGILNDTKNFLGASDISGYAEKFGYSRFFMRWENDNPLDIRISQLLSEMTYEHTHEITGGPANIEFPPFMGAVVSVKEFTGK